MSGKPLRGFKSHSLRQFEGFNSPLIYIELFTLCVDVTKRFKKKLNLTLEVLVRTYELPIWRFTNMRLRGTGRAEKAKHSRTSV